MEGKDPFQSFFKEAETIFRTLAEFEQALLNGPQPSPAQQPARRQPRSPREQILSKEYLSEENNDALDLSRVPGSQEKVYSDFNSPPPPPPPKPKPFAFPGGSSFGFGSFSSTSITQQYNSATGTTETIVEQSHHRDGKDYSCTQRFWQAADGTRQQEGECHDSHGRRLEPAMEAELLVSFCCPERVGCQFHQAFGTGIIDPGTALVDQTTGLTQSSLSNAFSTVRS